MTKRTSGGEADRKCPIVATDRATAATGRNVCPPGEFVEQMNVSKSCRSEPLSALRRATSFSFRRLL